MSIILHSHHYLTFNNVYIAVIQRISALLSHSCQVISTADTEEHDKCKHSWRDLVVA